MDREQINYYLQDGSMHATCCHSPQGGMGHKSTDFTPAREHNSSKGKGDLLPLLSAVSRPPLVPGDGHAHIASWATPWDEHS
jgi:hypothetical protein